MFFGVCFFFQINLVIDGGGMFTQTPKLKISKNVKILFIETKQKQKKRKQEAHGPHRSPEKTVQINKHI